MSIAAEPEGGRRAATKAANRAAIIAAARTVFAERGYGSTTIRDVIRRTDLASGTFYNYFPDKESLFRAVVDESAT
jgi:AcrR family transcriptional regulator